MESALMILEAIFHEVKYAIQCLANTVNSHPMEVTRAEFN